MKIANKYYEDEVREGFYIPGMLKRSMAAQLQVLDEVKKICERHDIKWFADYGTLIGAVRHHGFIPWDDDLDICMIQDDYLKFLRYAKDELPSGYRILNLDTEPEYTNFLTRIVNNDTINTNPDFLMENHGFPYTTGIDLFPLTYVYNDENKEKDRCKKSRELWKIQENLDDNSDKEKIISKVEAISGYKVDRKVSLTCGINRILEALFFECKNDESGMVMQASFYVRFNNHIYPTKYFKKAVELPFESGKINVPLCYEAKLTADYGNWAVANQAGGMHDYPVYGDQEEILRAHSGGKLYYRYAFEKEHLDLNKRKMHKNNADRILNEFEVLEKIYPVLNKVLSAKQNDNILSLATKCQELAAQIGTEIENRKGNLGVVSRLENYCEKLYDMCQNMDNSNVCMDILDELIRIHYEAKNLYIETKTKSNLIIFLVTSPDKWKYMEGVYLKYMVQSDADVRIMPIPYYDRLLDKSLSNEHFDYDFYSERYDVIDYRKFDFEHNHFKEIVTQEPFDEYDMARSIHPFFYISNIRNYTDKLTYIPGFRLDEIKDSFEKAKSNVKYYAVVPGVLLTDQVLLKSDNEKKRYLAAIEKELGKEISDLYDDKIEIVDIQENNEYLRNDKKKLAIYFSVSSFAENSAIAIKKLEKIVHVLADNKEKMEYVFIGENELFAQAFDSEVTDNVESLIRLFEKETMGRVYSSVSDLEIEDIAKSCDAYYGSPGYIMNCFVRKKKPVMMINMNF